MSRGAGVAVERAMPFLSVALYPNNYVWYIFLSSLDLMFTWLILHAGGREVNALAAWIIEAYNVRGLVAFKFLAVVFVVLICEIVGRRRWVTGLMVARWAVALSAFPVLVGGMHLLRLVLQAHDEAGMLPPGLTPLLGP